MQDNFQKLPEVVIDKAPPPGILMYIRWMVGREAFFTAKQTTDPRDNCPRGQPAGKSTLWTIVHKVTQLVVMYCSTVQILSIDYKSAG